jgi:excisionase family DNA binding protein
MKAEDNQIHEPKYTIQQVAHLLGGISRVTVWREIHRGNLSAYRIGGGLFIGERHLRQYLKDREVRAAN